MDISALASDVVAYLAPFLPYLVKTGEAAAEEAGKKIGAEAWEKAKTLWARLPLSGDGTESALEGVQDLRERSDDERLAVLRWQLKALLDDPALAQELAALMRGLTLVNATASGERSIAITEAKGSIITTGDTYNKP